MNELSHLIRSSHPASEWAEGYPIGNGRLGGMVLGDPLRERVALNHDRLWRHFWLFQEHHTAADLPELRRLIAAGRWDDAHDLLIAKIPVSSQALYLNPFVPACDLGIYPYHGKDEVSEYQRSLNLDEAIAEVSYLAGGVRYRREYFSSWPAGVIAIRLSASQAGRVRGEVTLSRLLDPDCEVSGSSKLGEVALEGRFEEGVRFAAVVRVVQRGGRLTGGRRDYQPPPGMMPPKDLNGLQFIFREQDYPHEPIGVSTCFDCADEVTLLAVIATEDETSGDLVGWCREKLSAAPADFEELHAGHVNDHRQYYRRVSLDLNSPPQNVSTGELIEESRRSGMVSTALVEQLFNVGRYLAIASGRPTPVDQPSKAPINLQGIWNQDRRPAWDCDYHLDLNLQMCYWPLAMVNLGELVPPMADWFSGLLPEARRAAQVLYGCRGAVWSAVCDLRHLGTTDDLCFGWTGAGAWVAQILWHHWEYSGDRDFLRDKVYPLLQEIGQFYEEFLSEDAQGRLVPVPSASPEMGIKGRKRYSALSSPSSMDLELIREVFSHLLAASEVLGLDAHARGRWTAMLDKIPLPPIDEQGCLQEWMVKHEPIDLGHRHRSPLIGLCPGDRITLEDTPDYYAAARKLLAQRQSSRATTCALACAWDAQLLARFCEGDAALQELNLITRTWLIDNLLLSICDWHDDATTLNWFPGRKVYQIEASLGMVAAIAEMFFQDLRGLLRLLPALPKAWPKGRLTGLRSRGGFGVDLSWDGGRLVEATIRSLRGEACRVKSFTTPGGLEVHHRGRKTESTCKGDIAEFPTGPGEVYTLRPKQERV
ncbi:MAG: glycoside hydrolase N-terminal domain-containing protein [Candidatus Latescibacteria bacterium]|nr:glycoside hydrolase N-terminal domain-containing protein [Candidatus Latescibacterota bacterium]